MRGLSWLAALAATITCASSLEYGPMMGNGIVPLIGVRKDQNFVEVVQEATMTPPGRYGLGNASTTLAPLTISGTAVIQPLPEKSDILAVFTSTSVFLPTATHSKTIDSVVNPVESTEKIVSMITSPAVDLSSSSKVIHTTPIADRATTTSEEHAILRGVDYHNTVGQNRTVNVTVSVTGSSCGVNETCTPQHKMADLVGASSSMLINDSMIVLFGLTVVLLAL